MQLNGVLLCDGTRQRVGIETEEPVEIYVEGDSIILTKYGQWPNGCFTSGLCVRRVERN